VVIARTWGAGILRPYKDKKKQGAQAEAYATGGPFEAQGKQGKKPPLQVVVLIVPRLQQRIAALWLTGLKTRRYMSEENPRGNRQILKKICLLPIGALGGKGWWACRR
jgi:hypothetical protein